MSGASKTRKKELEKAMDGAYFAYEQDKTPADFMNDSNGLRHTTYASEKKKPSGSMRTNLTWGTKDKTLPPRFIWNKGKWLSEQSDSDEWTVWVVSGEGTPGNYETREYEVPNEIAKSVVPKHPAEWPNHLKKGSALSTRSSGTSSSGTTSSGLPWGLRIRCTGCGHFYKMNDLSEHAKNACPATQDKPALWVIECECHENDLLAAAEVLPGFPIKPPAPKEAANDGEQTDDQAPDNVREETPTI